MDRNLVTGLLAWIIEFPAEWALPRRQIAGVDRTRHSSIVHTPGGYGERTAKWAAFRHETDGEVRLARDKFGMRSPENTLQDGKTLWDLNTQWTSVYTHAGFETAAVQCEDKTVAVFKFRQPDSS
ncbi:hypothetical protein ABBQ32_012936 [Trebouxia sp. C0010 RCD-2024]